MAPVVKPKRPVDADVPVWAGNKGFGASSVAGVLAVFTLPKSPPYFLYVVFIVFVEGTPKRPPVGAPKSPPVGVVEPKSPPGVGVVEPKSPPGVGVVEPKRPAEGLENGVLEVGLFYWTLGLDAKRPVEVLLLGLGGLSDGFPNMFVAELTILKQFLLIMD